MTARVKMIYKSSRSLKCIRCERSLNQAINQEGFACIVPGFRGLCIFVRQNLNPIFDRSQEGGFECVEVSWRSNRAIQAI